jgi:hypothetical protein
MEEWRQQQQQQQQQHCTPVMVTQLSHIMQSLAHVHHHDGHLKVAKV